MIDLKGNQQADELAKQAAPHHLPPQHKVRLAEAKKALTQACQDCIVAVWQEHTKCTNPKQAGLPNPKKDEQQSDQYNIDEADLHQLIYGRGP